jgi:hypothetical protein
VATIGAAARSRIGHRHRVSEVITVFDADAGRYLRRPADEGDGPPDSFLRS